MAHLVSNSAACDLKDIFRIKIKSPKVYSRHLMATEFMVCDEIVPKISLLEGRYP